MSSTGNVKRFKTALVWFRRDLRTIDNRALAQACTDAECVIPLFVLDKAILSRADSCKARVNFLMDCLLDLNERLKALGGRLIVLNGTNPETVVEAAVTWKVDCVYFHREFEPAGVARDNKVLQSLAESRIESRQVNNLMHVEPERLKTAAGSPYTVFTPYKRSWLNEPLDSLADVPQKVSLPESIRGVNVESELPGLKAAVDQDIPEGGETAALDLLLQFVQGSCGEYASRRDYPGISGTSRLSPHLHLGSISPRTVRMEVEHLKQIGSADVADSANTFISELCWREFYLSILHFFPHVETGAFKHELNSVPWEDNEASFANWTSGNTGYPIVDAAMRQLKSQAWMHNRARMIVASFLCKDLLVDWRWGERYFMQNLVDGDLASNNGGWQWTAGTGTDAQPYFRIFNPTSQALKFDPNGDYVRRWVPELAKVPAAAIHTPWKLSPGEKQYLKCQAYPDPIVDHSVQRLRALELYRSARKGASK